MTCSEDDSTDIFSLLDIMTALYTTRSVHTLVCMRTMHSCASHLSALFGRQLFDKLDSYVHVLAMSPDTSDSDIEPFIPGQDENKLHPQAQGSSTGSDSDESSSPAVLVSFSPSVQVRRVIVLRKDVAKGLAKAACFCTCVILK